VTFLAVAPAGTIATARRPVAANDIAMISLIDFFMLNFPPKERCRRNHSESNAAPSAT
jgi:hypothetical protein